MTYRGDDGGLPVVVLPGINTGHGAQWRPGAVAGNDKTAAEHGTIIKAQGCPRIIALHGDNACTYRMDPRGAADRVIERLPENPVLHDPSHGMIADIPMVVVKEEGRLAIRDADIKDGLGVGHDVMPCIQPLKNELRTPGNGGHASVERTVKNHLTGNSFHQGHLESCLRHGKGGRHAAHATADDTDVETQFHGSIQHHILCDVITGRTGATMVASSRGHPV